MVSTTGGFNITIIKTVIIFLMLLGSFCSLNATSTPEINWLADFGMDSNLLVNPENTSRYTMRLAGAYGRKNKNHESVLKGEYVNKEDGRAFSLEHIGEYDLNEDRNIWYSISYRDIQQLHIKNQLNFKIGGGIVLFKNKELFKSRRIKASYGLIARGNKLLNSFRLKDKYECGFLDTFSFGHYAQIDYILPFAGNFSELEITVSPFVKAGALEPGMIVKYHRWGEYQDYYIAMNIRITLDEKK